MYHTSSISTENINIVVHLCIRKEKYYVIVTFFFITNFVNTPIKCNTIHIVCYLLYRARWAQGIYLENIPYT